MTSTKKSRAERVPDLAPYLCFTRDCENLVKPTVRSRPWLCPECLKKLKEHIVKVETRKSQAPAASSRQKWYRRSK